MRLYPRIVFFLLASCVVPLLVLAVSVVRVAHGWLDRTVVQVQVDTAKLLAGTVSRQLADGERLLALQLGSFRLGDASDEARAAFLYATWRLDPDFTIVALQDAAGRDVVDPVYEPPAGPSLAPGHDPVTVDRLEDFRSRIPVLVGSASRGRGRAWSPVGGSAAAIPLALASPWGDGLALAVELRLAGIGGEAASIAGAEGEVALLGEDGLVLYREGAADLVDPSSVAALAGTSSAEVRYTSRARGVGVLAAMAAVPGYPMSIIVASPASVVESAADDIQRRTAYIGAVTLVAGVLMGTFLTRSITQPVERLREATAAVGRGDLSRRVALGGRDELAELAEAFNRMAAGLQASGLEIAAKNEEIEGFNRELMARVEQRTAQLREAQSRLVQSGQLAAVAELSAGLAHELNNPLAGILGMIQIILARQPEGSPSAGLLRAAEKEALRCKEIVAQLLRFASPPATTETPRRDRLELGALVSDVLALLGPALRARSIEVEHRPSPVPVPVRGDAGALGRALGQLVTSVRTVAAPGARLTVGVRRDAAMARLDISVDRATSASDDWRAASLGFWVARQILEEHDATLEEPGEPRSGAPRWRVALPDAGGDP